MMMCRRSTLWLFGLTLAVGVGAGCVSGDDRDARMSVSWRVAYVGGGGVTCKNADTPKVRLDARSHETGEIFDFEYGCEGGRGVTAEIPGGWYDVQLTLLDSKDRAVAGTTGEFELRNHGTTHLDRVQFEVQSWEVSWAFSIEANGSMRPGRCDEVGVKTVEFIAQQASEAAESFPFDCEFGLGFTTAVRAGSYAYKTRLLDGTGRTVAESPVRSQVLGSKIRGAVKEIFPFK